MPTLPRFKRRAYAGGLLLLAAYAAPLIVYLVNFGPTLSVDHQRWAEFGSAMAGIYAPIVALTTLVVLRTQVLLQRQINEHQYEQAYLEQARTNIEFYAVRLVAELDKHLLPGQTIRDAIHKHFQPRGVRELDAPELRTLAANIDSSCPAPLALWFAIYPILKGLGVSTTSMSRMTRTSSIQKLIALLSFETCVALNNYHRTRTEGRIDVPYYFSPLLSSNSEP